MCLFGLQGAQLCFPWPPLHGFLSPLDFPLQSGYYPSETVAYLKHHQHLTHRGVVWPLEIETPFLVGRGTRSLRGAVKMKKFKLILLIPLFTLGLSCQMVNAQDPLEILASKPSLNGLETSDYRRVRIGIEPLNEAARKFGLTEERIRSRYELRLRQYGLEPVSISDQTAGFVYIGIHVVGMAFHTWVDFGR